jgi:GT2 family glycosyltransferase
MAGRQAGGWLTGSCILVRISGLREVGVFDPAFFLFFEDTDLCLRLREAGWKLRVCSSAAILHHGHKTTSESDLSGDIGKQFLRSRFLFFTKHRGSLMAHAVTELVRCGLALRTTKMLLEASMRGRAADLACRRSLWALTAYRPSRPTKLELDAELSARRPRRGSAGRLTEDPT